MRTTAVDTVTTLLVVRYRIELVLPGRQRTVTQIAEDAQFLAYTLNDEDAPVWLDDDGVAVLLAARPTGSVNDDLARAQLELALGRQHAITPHLERLGSERAAATMEAHRQVRRSSGLIRRGLTARFLPEADVLGTYVFLPDRASR